LLDLKYCVVLSTRNTSSKLLVGPASCHKLELSLARLDRSHLLSCKGLCHSPASALTRLSAGRPSSLPRPLQACNSNDDDHQELVSSYHGVGIRRSLLEELECGGMQGGLVVEEGFFCSRTRCMSQSVVPGWGGLRNALLALFAACDMMIRHSSTDQQQATRTVAPHRLRRCWPTQP
jgi:hypothetical protein